MVRRIILSSYILAFGVAVANAAGTSRVSPFLQHPSGVERSDLLLEVLEPHRSTLDPIDGDLSVCRPRGQIHDACADYESVEVLNDQHIFKRLDDLCKTKYFRYFLVDLYKDCPFWPDDSLCMSRDCVVEKLNETDVPEQFRAARLGEVNYVGEEGGEVSDSGKNVNFCYLDDEDSSTEAAYVDLLKNPERFTGYSGVSANRVWRSIYEENCFNSNKFRDPPSSAAGGTGFISPHQVKMASKHGSGGTMSKWDAGGLDTLIQSVEAPEDPGSTEHCLEKRVFYRIISGLHASISIHICSEYLDPATNTWGPNLECFLTRIAQHPERLQNVYFDYVLLIRALSKAGEYMNRFELREGDQIKDDDTKKQLEGLLRHAGANRPSFDEHNLFAMTNDPVQNRATLQLKEDFRTHFMNVSRIMDCVGCDKCRLWGKLQFAGIGTALKLLFAFEETASQTPVTLRRTELVALINTAHRISESIHAVDTFRNLYQESARPEEKYNAPPEKPPPERPDEHVPDPHSLLHKIAHAVRYYLSVAYRRLSTPQADL